ncbi:MAG: helix-turn-helix transcriptional regulator [Brevundimonas sp.]|jgi:phage repressor protein C with HTH and peptisase S24 domain|uniref:Helix-turn-helix transcriptional regulator n=1 Tax=Brevundimonas albigilva TaxID=1312364 RepID=A0ABY4STB0_9CAUL|nr:MULTISPECIES: helix-turn-helix transcriptional regulator [Brevundimonas]PZU61646.1 MAG: helix-turn-helix transcriptional regulator [Brevundimonas sp.]UQV19014.1 helix-turn-helix transcriptional regulator [Brevundimonas albigilva]URI16098.1 helix-turn-helix transcriptional regulator [Brevundimonas albigilva]
MPLSHARLWKALDALARREGLSPSGLALRAGLDATAFNPSKRFGAGDPPRPRWPSTESLTRILEATGVSLADFAALADDAPPTPAVIPLLGLARAGQDGFFDEAGLPVGDGWDQTELPRPSAGLFSLRISGDSMAPAYRDGDRVIVDREAAPPRRGDRIVARLATGEVVAKELARLTSRTATLTSANPDYPPRVVPRADIEWMARILWVSQ